MSLGLCDDQQIVSDPTVGTSIDPIADDIGKASHVTVFGVESGWFTWNLCGFGCVCVCGWLAWNIQGVHRVTYVHLELSELHLVDV